MLVQHLLTERIFRRIFDNPEFTRRNIIAAEIEKTTSLPRIGLSKTIPELACPTACCRYLDRPEM